MKQSSHPEERSNVTRIIEQIEKSHPVLENSPNGSSDGSTELPLDSQ